MQATSQYRTAQDTTGEFVSEHIIHQEDSHTEASKVYERYKQWSEKTGEQPLSSKMFRQAMEERGFEYYKNCVMCWRGVLLSPQGDASQVQGCADIPF